MKPTVFLILCLFFTSHYIYSQTYPQKTRGVFYKFSLATTLAINEDYVAFDDSDETLINPSALFVNNTIGYQFDKRTLLGLNFEYDWHSQQGLHFFPAYLNFQYSLNKNIENSAFFVRFGYGTLLGISNDFEKGNIYKFGLGGQFFSKNGNSFLIGLDFSRKRFGYKTLEGLSSVSIFIEFMVF